MKNSIFTDGWEKRLDELMLTNNRCRKKAYICSPLGADTKEKVLENMHTARAYMYYVSEVIGCTARAPHAYLPVLLCDKIPSELEQCDLLLVCGNRISPGMMAEIIKAVELNMDILVFDENVYGQAKKIVMSNGGKKALISYEFNHPTLTFDGVGRDDL